MAIDPLNIGDVIEIPAGLRVYHNQGKEIIEVRSPVRVVIEANRKVLPFQQTGVEAHFEECYMLKARALNPDGSYHPEGALLTFAQYGDFRPEFLLPEGSNKVLWRMKQSFVPADA
jgi:hypothetical protein